MRKLIPPDFAPGPDAIDASGHLWDAFDHCETEISAGWIIRLCQERGRGWEPFSRAEIEAFYARKDGFTFNQLLSRGFLIPDTADRFHFTDDFVLRCFKSSPRKEGAA